MMYKNNFIAVVKNNGRILREMDGNVRLPFGSEYSILLKNKDSRKAVVSISIDGESVTENRIIVDGSSDAELFGFLEGNRVRNKFKFIQKTDEIVRHRGDKADDGIVTVEYWFEERVETVRQKFETTWGKPYTWYDATTYIPRDYTISYGTGDNLFSGITIHTATNVSSSLSSNNISPDEGITVKGSEVNQDFNYGHTNKLENQSSVINIILKGYQVSGVQVKVPLVTSQKVQCPTCGMRAKSYAKYCSNCGTYLM